MSRRLLLIVAASLAGVAVLGVGGLYAYITLSNRDAPPPVSLTSQTPLPQVSPATSGAGSAATTGASSCDTAAVDGAWTVSSDGQSFAGYRVTEQLASLPAQGDAVGRTAALTGSMTISGTSVTAATFIADLTKLTSNESRRDNFIRHDGLESSTFPMSMFTLSQPLSIGTIPPAGQALSATAHGSLLLHGVTRTVDIPLQAQRTCAGIEIIGSLPVTFSDYGMTAPSIGGFVSVQDHGTMELKLELVRGT